MINEKQLAVIKQYEKEFSVDSKGCGYVSQRGLARLCGVSHRSWGQGGSFFTSEIVELLASHGLEGGSIDLSKGIPDTIATIVIKHYAYKGKKEAQQIDVVIGVIGLRVLIQQMCGYQSQIQPQPQEQTVSTWIIDRFEKLEEQINNLQESANEHKRHIKELQSIIDEADQLWLTFPQPEAKIPTNSRQLVLLLIHHSVIKFRRPIAKIWEEAYAYFRYRSGFDAKARTRNTGKAPLDLIFELGMGDAFYTACYELLVERYPTKYNK